MQNRRYRAEASWKCLTRGHGGGRERRIGVRSDFGSDTNRAIGPVPGLQWSDLIGPALGDSRGCTDRPVLMLSEANAGQEMRPLYIDYTVLRM